MSKNRKSKQKRTKQNQQTIPASADVEGEGIIPDDESVEPEAPQTESETPQSETPTADMPAPEPEPKPKKVKHCPMSGCNHIVVDKGNGQLQCKGRRRHTFVEPGPDTPPKPKPADNTPANDGTSRCPWPNCNAPYVETKDKKTGVISYKCKGRSRHTWEK